MLVADTQTLLEMLRLAMHDSHVVCAHAAIAEVCVLATLYREPARVVKTHKKRTFFFGLEQIPT